MPPAPVSTRGSKAMDDVAKHYADELSSQFRSLNHFVPHAGEIGRAHETFLRGLLTRFLPRDVRLSTGFVAHPLWTSLQQDILIHNPNFATLFEVGDCTVIDYEAFIGVIEVKTQLSSSQNLREAVEAQADLRIKMGHLENLKNRWHKGLFAIYAWDGMSYDTAIEALWEFVRKDPVKNCHLLPDILCIRGKYVLRASLQDELNSPPFHVWHIGDNGISDGAALLGIVCAIWDFGIRECKPWWLLSWDDCLGKVFGKVAPVQWPEDLQQLIAADPVNRPSPQDCD